MAHKTMIAGTVYDTVGGSVLTDGTAYGIQKGRTLLEGTAYEIRFSSPVTVVVTGSGNNLTHYAQIDGYKVWSAQTLEYASVKLLYLYAKSSIDTGGLIEVNGEKLKRTSGSTAATGYVQVPEGTTRITIQLEAPMALKSSPATIRVTTE